MGRRLIYADELIKALNLAEWFNIADFNEAVSTVRKAQPVDAVPVQRCKDCINQEIEELKENGEKHSDEVRQNGMLIADGLRMALRIVEEIFWKDGEQE